MPGQLTLTLDDQVFLVCIRDDGVRLVLLEAESFIRLHAFVDILLVNIKTSKSVNNASLTPSGIDETCFKSGLARFRRQAR